MKNPMAGGGKKPRQVSGMETVPAGAQMLPLDVKRRYETNPVHLYHPTPYNAITVLRSRERPHDYLVLGWYLDTFRERGTVKGLVYRFVATEDDKEHVTAELKKLDKEATINFTV